MDQSHVALCALILRTDGFQHFRCDRPIALGLHLEHLTKVLKCSGNDDLLTLKSEDDTDMINLMFENESKILNLVLSIILNFHPINTDQDRISDFEMKLMTIDSESLGIPETDYCVNVTMSAAEFQKIIRDLKEIGFFSIY